MIYAICHLKIIQKLHRKGQNKILTELSLLGQEPTFKCQKVDDKFYVCKNFKICFFNQYHIESSKTRELTVKI